MNYASVLEYFLDSEFEVLPTSHMNQDTISVCIEVGDRLVTLVHYCLDELRQLPQFFLEDYSSFGVLAHVLPSQDHDGCGYICVNHLDSISINFERPELAFEESIKRHVKLLNSVILDPKFNKHELLREFQTNWNLNTKGLMNKVPKTLYCTTSVKHFTLLDIYEPLSKDSFMSIPSSFVARPDKESDQSVEQFFRINLRQKYKDSVGCILPLECANPIIPDSTIELKNWLLNTLQGVLPITKDELKNKFYPIRAKEFWLVLNISTPSGHAWVGVKLSLSKKRAFPCSSERMKDWKIEPIYLEVFNKELMLPRSGANLSLSNKKVLLIGCGSVGSEIAHKLGSTGIGYLSISDPDSFSTSNLYRHTLNGYMTGWPKALAVAFQLQEKFPWIKTSHHTNSLLEYRFPDFLEPYDLIIIAIGAPTHERLFHDYLAQSSIKTPVIYSWLEGYGIGGHAVLDIPNGPGCLRCAYVEANSGVRGLASNLNFIKANQNVVKNYAGCGEMFIPYGAISSTQTAILAADLAIGYLDEKLKESKKMSWKGDSLDAEREGLKLTQRYQNFSASLQKLPLRHPLCDVCQPKKSIIYQSKCGKRLYLPVHLNQELFTYRQDQFESIESAGLLIGYYNQNGEVFIDTFTTPKITDQRTRATFKLEAKLHQSEVDKIHIESEKILGYLGTWHTHPQDIPNPSYPDKNDWRIHVEDNPDRPLFFIIVGIKKTSVYTLDSSGKTIQLFVV